MDRKSQQKVKFIDLLFAVIVLILLLSGGKIAYENTILRQQKQEISIIYPENEQGLKENLDYYQNIIARENIIFIVIIIFIIILFFVTNYLFNKQKDEALKKELDSELNVLYEQLCLLRNGNEIELTGFQEFKYEKIGDILDQFKELGYDIFSMRARLKDEENKTKSLITDISHQLKTPLSSIRMNHELSLADDLSEEERRSFFEIETKEILKMEELLDELVKLSRLEYSMIQINSKPNSLKSTISEAASIVYMKANAKNIDISLDMEEDVQLLHDHKWTVEAFSNIIENAVKYSDEHTSVQIRVCSLVSNVLIEIEDEGIGIPENTENAIFKRFYRGDNAKKVSKDGAGVGLYLARNIIEQQGGTIVAKRKSGLGSIFKIMLPL